MVGFFISKTSWTRFGRLMPWIMFSTPFAIISYFLIWFVPDISTGQVMWYLVFYCAFQTLVTCFHVPYSALTMFISREQSERDSATAYRMTVEVLGTVLGTAIQGQIVGKVDTPCVGSPFFFGLTNSSVAMEELNMTHDTGSLTDTRNAYMIAAGVIGGLYMLCALILLLGVRERRESCELQSDEPVSFFQGLKLVMNHGPYIKLIAGFLFTSLAFMLLEGNFALFCTYTLGFRNEFQNILLAIMLSATLTIPFWQWFLTRFGKKTAVYVGISVHAARCHRRLQAAAPQLPWPRGHLLLLLCLLHQVHCWGLPGHLHAQPGLRRVPDPGLLPAWPGELHPEDVGVRCARGADPAEPAAVQALPHRRGEEEQKQESPAGFKGGEQQQLGVGQHRAGQHRVTQAGCAAHAGAPQGLVPPGLAQPGGPGGAGGAVGSIHCLQLGICARPVACTGPTERW
ncbi:sodium-dependent lysophosphatidylcholine symporter 1 isoform X1 [Onychostruthus taczanowskii]|uniref:sodium-dependent lysophosphatidylcholine symporter 1 isoform X1 n=1 Tax=Onychostruthus taczanowskii TaxID=356909 RepID=UPI001B80DF55|nr:sodium-dependent lysophosphatidylcholine symporter 1 isoform X1 [Onychostruthus taczanowskii]